jgi:ABC-2 type transport system permease protein
VIALIGTEARRDLSRWAIRILVALGVLAIVVLAVALYLATGPEDGVRLVDIWPKDGQDGILLVTGFFLFLGGFFGGATVLGAEWKANTMATLLTWEPRRVRVGAVKIVVAAVLAFAIAVLLQILLVVLLMPTIWHVGTTTGGDAEFWWGVLGAMTRIGAVTGLCAAFGAALTLLGRNTALTLGALFGYIAVAEPILRGLKPQWSQWYVAENISRFVTAAPLIGSEFQKSTVGAALTLVVYALLVAALAVFVFRQRDLTGAT